MGQRTDGFSSECGEDRAAQREDRDVQFTTHSTLKSGERSDTLTFTLDFLLLRLVCICVIPGEGDRHAPVYVKFRLRGAREVLNGTPVSEPG